MRLKWALSLIWASALFATAADYRPNQDINTVEAYKDSDGFWHINSTYYCAMKVTYKVSNISLSAVDENGRFPEQTDSLIIQRKENLSVGVRATAAVYVSIVKLEYAHSDTTAGEGSPSSSSGGKPGDAEGSTEENPPRINRIFSLKRSQSSGRTAFGSVFVNGRFVCYFMERSTDQNLFKNGNFNTIFEFTSDGATIKVDGSIEQLQFGTKLVRDSDGSFSAVDSDGSQQAGEKLNSELGLSTADSIITLPTEVGDFPSADSFQQ